MKRLPSSFHRRERHRCRRFRAAFAQGQISAPPHSRTIGTKHTYTVMEGC